MTYYFDTQGQELTKLFTRESSFGKGERDQLAFLDKTVAEDCLTCTQFPGFPAELAERVYTLILTYSMECRPVNAESNTLAKDYEELHDHLEGISTMFGQLHDVFHDLKNMNIPGFSDDPKMPLRTLLGEGEQVLYERVEKMKGPPPDYGTCTRCQSPIDRDGTCSSFCNDDPRCEGKR